MKHWGGMGPASGSREAAKALQHDRRGISMETSSTATSECPHHGASSRSRRTCASSNRPVRYASAASCSAVTPCNAG